MWRINKTLTKADGRLVGRKEELEDKLISGFKRMETLTRAVSVLWIKFRFSLQMPVLVVHTQLNLLL
jgi:hypothetical protein